MPPAERSASPGIYIYICIFFWSSNHVKLLHTPCDQQDGGEHLIHTASHIDIKTDSVQQRKCATHDVHEREEVVLHVLLSVKANHRVVDPQQDFDVVVVLSGVSAAAAAGGLVDPPGHRVQGGGYVQLCTGRQRDNVRQREERLLIL